MNRSVTDKKFKNNGAILLMKQSSADIGQGEMFDKDVSTLGSKRYQTIDVNSRSSKSLSRRSN